MRTILGTSNDVAYSRTFVATVVLLALFAGAAAVGAPIPESSLNVAIAAFGFKEGMGKIARQ